MPVQVQDSDQTKLEVHGSVRARLKVKNSYRIRRSPQQCHCRCKATKLQVRGSVREQIGVKNSYKIRREGESSASAAARQ